MRIAKAKSNIRLPIFPSIGITDPTRRYIIGDDHSALWFNDQCTCRSKSVILASAYAALGIFASRLRISTGSQNATRRKPFPNCAMLSFRDSEAGNTNCTMTELKKDRTVAEIPQSSISLTIICRNVARDGLATKLCESGRRHAGYRAYCFDFCGQHRSPPA